MRLTSQVLGGRLSEEDADGELLKELLGLMRAYLNAQANPLQPPTTEELGVSEPTPYDSEDELFS